MDEKVLLLIEIGGLLFAMSLLGRLAMRLGVTPIPFYLLLGLGFGEGGLVPVHASGEFLQVGSDLGVILLLAMLGLEYTADELAHSLRASGRAGIVDAVLNALPGAATGLLLGWGPVGAVALAGVTWVSSSGVVAKLLRDLGRLANRETPAILSVLVIEDLAMALYLPVLLAIVVGLGIWQGAIAVGVAVTLVVLILVLALRHGRVISRLFPADQAEPLLLGVLGLTMLIAGLAEQVHVSAAVGAFLVGIALSGRVAANASAVLTPLRDLFAALFFVFFGLRTDAGTLLLMLPVAVGLAVVTAATKMVVGWYAARRAGIGTLGRWRAGFTLVPRGEFSVVIAGLATGSSAIGSFGQLVPLATGYVLITMLLGVALARVPDAGWFRRAVKR